jgi:hypothetical protein
MEVLVAFREHQRRSPLTYGLHDLVANSSIPSLVINQELVKRLKLNPFVGRCAARWMKGSGTDEDRVLEGPRGRLRSCVHAMAYGTALHEDDRMVTVLPRDRRGQTSDESSLCAADDLFKAVGRQVVAFIDDHLPIVTDTVIYDTVADKTLNDSYVEQSGRLISAAADSSDRLCGQFQKGCEALDPLIEQLPTMNEHQCIDAALCDKSGGNNRLAEGRRRGQHTDLMFQHRVGGQLLLRSQLALKGHLQWLSAIAFVVDDGPNIQVRQNLTDIVQTAARDADVMRMSSAQPMIRGLS